MKTILTFLAAALAMPASLAAQHYPEWTVVTLARDGSWGAGTSEHYGPALASALRKCEAMSGGQSDCGAEVTAVRNGWTLGILCGDHRVLVAQPNLTAAALGVPQVGRSSGLCRPLPQTLGPRPDRPRQVASAFSEGCGGAVPAGPW